MQNNRTQDPRRQGHGLDRHLPNPVWYPEVSRERSLERPNRRRWWKPYV